MIFFDYYFKAHATPKYLEPIAISMERRHQALMADEPTLKKFIEELKSELNSIPKAKERYELKADKGYIYINTTHGLTEGVLRLHYKEVLHVEGSLWSICKSINELVEERSAK